MADLEFVGHFPVGQDRPGLGTDVRLSHNEAVEEVALPHNAGSRCPPAEGGHGAEGKRRTPAVAMRALEDKDDPSFTEDCEA